MSRARNLKPGFFKNEALVELPFEYRLLFAGLWTLADREGRLEDRPKRIRMEIFPGDDVDCDAGLAALACTGLVVRYEIEGIAYVWIPTFLEHQKPHLKEAASTIPPYLGNGEHLPRSLPAPTKAMASPAESLLSESPLSESLGKPSCRAAPDESRALKAERHSQALQYLEFLNGKAKKHFRPVPANLKFVEARLAEGVTLQDLKTLTVRKCREWLGTDQEKYLRPETLCNATKCNSYLGEITPEEQPCNAPDATGPSEAVLSPAIADGAHQIIEEAVVQH